MKYRKKPVKITAKQWTGDNYEEIARFANIKLDQNPKGQLLIPTLEGTMRASRGDYIIKGVRGELYPIKESIFKDTYEAVEEEEHD